MNSDSNKTLNIVVLLGGISPERNISMLSGAAVAAALRRLGHHVTCLDPARGVNSVVTEQELHNLSGAEPAKELLESFHPRSIVECLLSDNIAHADVVFIALHGRYGEDGYVQSILDMIGKPYTGSGMQASALAIDKATSKLLFSASGVPTAHWATVNSGQEDDEDLIQAILKELPGKVIVKPNDQGSTVGMTIVEEGYDNLRAAIRTAAQYSDTVLIERFIEGRELTVAVVEGEALPPIDIIPHDGYYDYKNKYTAGRTEYQCPAHIPEEVENHLLNLAVTAFSILGCSSVGRVDFRLNEDNIPVCLEVNTIPGFTATSLVPMAAAEAGIDFDGLCKLMLEMALKQQRGAASL